MLLFPFRDLEKVATFQMKGEPVERELFTTESRDNLLDETRTVALFPTRSYRSQGLQH